MKVVAPGALARHLATLDYNTECFQQITGIALSAAARKQLFLPCQLGGVGLKGSSDLVLAAFATTLDRGALLGCPELLWEQGTAEFQQVLGLLKQQAPPAAVHAVCWLADHVSHRLSRRFPIPSVVGRCIKPPGL